MKPTCKSMYLRQPDLELWVPFLHFANGRLRRGNQARYRIADSVDAVGIGSHIPFEDIAIARVQKALQGLSTLNYVVM